jgi:3-hydroxyisobutyrate dehydrogenase-like beta-hydroxyacid dehydrogenase
MKIGFIGLGPFGTAILQNLMKSHPNSRFYLFDRDPINFIFDGFQAKIAPNPAKVVEKSDFIFTRFSGFEAFKEVIFQRIFLSIFH